MPIRLPDTGNEHATEELGVTLINVMAVVADLNAHYQELLARETYLGTAGTRASIGERQRVAAEFRMRLERIRNLLNELELASMDS